MSELANPATSFQTAGWLTLCIMATNSGGESPDSSGCMAQPGLTGQRRLCTKQKAALPGGANH